MRALVSGAEGFVAFEDEGFDATPGEGARAGEADDAGTDDDCLIFFHRVGIVIFRNATQAAVAKRFLSARSGLCWILCALVMLSFMRIIGILEPFCGMGSARCRRILNMQTPPKATNVSMAEPLLAEAKALRINISQAAEAGVARAVAEAGRTLAAGESGSDRKLERPYVEKHGLPLEKFRTF